MKKCPCNTGPICVVLDGDHIISTSSTSAFGLGLRCDYRVHAIQIVSILGTTPRSMNIGLMGLIKLLTSEAIGEIGNFEGDILLFICGSVSLLKTNAIQISV